MHHIGKRIAGYGRTKEQARQKLRDMIKKHEQGLPLLTSNMLLVEYLGPWLEKTRHLVLPKTFVNYEVAVRIHIAPNLGHISLGKLDQEHIEKAWAAMLRGGHSVSVVQYAHLSLSKALADALGRKDAKGRHLIDNNPCRGVSPPRARPKELHPPDADAIHRILEAASGTEYYEALYTAFYTGLRRVESLGLRWRDVDLNLGTISVSRTVYRAKGGQSIYDDPKTKRGRRLVNLTPSTVIKLRRLKERQQAESLLVGYQVGEDTLVFRYRDGSPILPNGFSGAFTRIMRRAGLEGYRLHDARHSHVEAGGSPKDRSGAFGTCQGRNHAEHL